MVALLWCNRVSGWRTVKPRFARTSRCGRRHLKNCVCVCRPSVMCDCPDVITRGVAGKIDRLRAMLANMLGRIDQIGALGHIGSELSKLWPKSDCNLWGELVRCGPVSANARVETFQSKCRPPSGMIARTTYSREARGGAALGVLLLTWTIDGHTIAMTCSPALVVVSMLLVSPFFRSHSRSFRHNPMCGLRLDGEHARLRLSRLGARLHGGRA